ncbi:MAG TPA: outer membrane lipoprotein carrier protein LolA [Gammaproteobacteria bacterium]|nr:outer membrane lipoprotein carrier protein LolA [Gammaproteobacteria bacterium]
MAIVKCLRHRHPQGIELKMMTRLLLMLFLLFVNVATPASTTQDLQRFFTKVQRYQASFDQVVLDEAMNPIQESSGNVWIERPGKFRWQYSTPYEQQIVGDGKQVWVYDVELKQVAVRRMAGALGNTPAMLLAGKGSLDANFAIKDLGRQGNLDWVQMKPKKNDGGFDDIRIGFENGKIRTLEMVDGFGQLTRVTFKAAKENPAIRAETFQFTPPKGVDVITE